MVIKQACSLIRAKVIDIEYVCRNIRIMCPSLIEKSDLNGNMQSMFGFRASLDEVLQARIGTKENEINEISQSLI